jgi:hypothetical protein
VLNFGEKPVDYTPLQGVTAARLVLANMPGTPETGTPTLQLGAWDARVYTY